PDGTAYQTTGTNFANAGNNTTHVTAISPAGTTDTVLSGFPLGSVLFGPDGAIYQTTAVIDSGSITTHVFMIGPTGATETTIPGIPTVYTLISPTGTAYQNTAAYDSTTGDTAYFITAISPGGTVTATQLPGAPYGDSFGQPQSTQFAADGTVYQVTSTGDTTTGYSFHVTVITPGGANTAQLPGTPSGAIQVGPDGTAYQLIDIHDSVTDDHSYAVTTITAGGATTIPLPGYPRSTVLFGPDNIVYVTTSSDDPTDFSTQVTAITPTGYTTTPLTGYATGGVRISPDGTVYQLTATIDSSGITNYVTTFTPNGHTTTELPGAFLYSWDQLVFDADGTAYKTTFTGDATIGYTTHVTAFTATGHTTTSFAGHPADHIKILPDGTVLQSVDLGDDVTRFVLIRSADITPAV
ncbi:MAG: hypothetical protein KC435_14855, partial [Thermomicrobiales bacterium]|nr:hypothetical protein [Thermomicrobiales bacterium]